MANNYIPDGTLALLIGDGGLTRATPTPTKVSGDSVNACLETQSTTRADVFMKPKTDAQIAAIPNPTNGMMAFSSDLDSVVARGNDGWAPVSGTPSPISYRATSISTVQILDLETTSVELVPAPGEGMLTVLHSIQFILIDGGTNIDAADGLAAFYVGDSPAAYRASNIFPNTFFNEVSINRGKYVVGDSVYGPTVDPFNFLYIEACINSAIVIRPWGTYSASGGTTTFRIHVWYSTIEAY